MPFPHQRVTKANEAILYQYDIPLSQFIGMTPKGFFAHDAECGNLFGVSFFNQGRLYIESEQRKQDGTPMWIEGNYICLYDEQEVVLPDISAFNAILPAETG